MTTEEAVIRLRGDPAFAAQMRDAYLNEDVLEAAQRFERSGEFLQMKAILGPALAGGAVLDLGAGTGIASRAFGNSGARIVVALEPDESPVVGQGAIRRSCGGAVEIVSGFGEALPFRRDSFDVVYARQVLHHARDLTGLLVECARVLRPGGLFLACREHVVDDEAQLRTFLEGHPVHRLAGGEGAFPLPRYLEAIAASGLAIQAVLSPWSSVINAYPAVNSDAELPRHARRVFIGRHGILGRIALLLPGMDRVARRQREEPLPGRLFSFVCRK